MAGVSDVPHEIRCPQCRLVAWFSGDGVIEETEEGWLNVVGSFEGVSTWSCMECGYEVPAESRLAARLREIAHRGRGRPGVRH